MDFNFKNIEKVKEESYLNNIPQEKMANAHTVLDLENKIKDAEELKKRVMEEYNITDDKLSDKVKLLFVTIDKEIDDYKKEIETLKYK